MSHRQSGQSLCVVSSLRPCPDLQVQSKLSPLFPAGPTGVAVPGKGGLDCLGGVSWVLLALALKKTTKREGEWFLGWERGPSKFVRYYCQAGKSPKTCWVADHKGVSLSHGQPVASSPWRQQPGTPVGLSPLWPGAARAPGDVAWPSPGFQGTRRLCSNDLQQHASLSSQPGE